MPGGGAAAGEPPLAVPHPGAQHMELHRGAAVCLTQCHPQPAESAGLGRAGQDAIDGIRLHLSTFFLYFFIVMVIYSFRKNTFHLVPTTIVNVNFIQGDVSVFCFTCSFTCSLSLRLK